MTMQIVDDPDQKTPPAAEQKHTPQPKRYYLTGIALLFLGILYFLQRATNLNTPLEFISWELILIIVGVYIGEKHSFKGISWLICIAIGAWFLLDAYIPDVNLRYYFGPLLLIGIGAYLLFGDRRIRYRGGRYNRYKRPYTREQGFASDNSATDDYIDVVSIFGGVSKQMFTKQFKGGEATSIFGGTEINLMQADFEGNAVLELTQIFGGCTLIIPPHWDLKTEVVSIFGGVEDNRPNSTKMVDHKRVLLLKGTSVFGGIEIKSY
jgi:hypothetical protein